MLQPWRKGIVRKIEEETFHTKRFWIEVPELESFDFKPGQFVTLDLPIHEQKNKRWRSYSIASYPDGTNLFELLIVLLEGGAGTEYIFKEWEPGSEVMLRGPQGIFVLPETIEKDLFLICTGTGIAPFRSMVHHIRRNEIPYHHIYLIFGCRRATDALYEKELRALEKEMERFHYLPVFSREDPNLNEIRTGYVHVVYQELLENRNDRDAFFMLCGWKNMIDEAKANLLEMGFDKKDIHLELYG